MHAGKKYARKVVRRREGRGRQWGCAFGERVPMPVAQQPYGRAYQAPVSLGIQKREKLKMGEKPGLLVKGEFCV